jgi:choice-of-anchor A domain-containing protein
VADVVVRSDVRAATFNYELFFLISWKFSVLDTRSMNLSAKDTFSMSLNALSFTFNRAMGRLAASTVAASALFLGTAPAHAGDVSWTNFSLVTIGTSGDPGAGNVSTGSEVTGSVFVSGNITNSITVGALLPSVSNPKLDPQYALSVVGNIGANINMSNGYSAIYAGSLSGGGVNLNGGGILTHDITGILAGEQSTLFSQVTGASSAFSGMATTGTVTVDNPQNYGQPANAQQPANTVELTYNGAVGGVAVFNLAYSTLTSRYQNLDLHLNGASSVVINVTGTPTNASVPNIIPKGDLTDANASKIIWNFGTVSTLSISANGNFIGSVLAPDATLTANQDIDGSVYVSDLKSAQEIHNVNNGYTVAYDGYNPESVGIASVPEPSTIMMASLGAIGVGLAVLRNRKSKLSITR